MIYVVRHGETEWNKLHKIMGRVDIPLNETGRKQAEKTNILLLTHGGVSAAINCYYN